MQNNTDKLKVFFGCSMRGGQAVVSREELAQFPEIIESLGFVLASKHQTEKGVLEKENALTPVAIHDRDYDWLLASDVGVFEISNPSLGVGAEIADMLHMGKPVLCLFSGDKDKVSAYIRGKEGSKHITTSFAAKRYASLAEAKRLIEDFVTRHAQQ